MSPPFQLWTRPVYSGLVVFAIFLGCRLHGADAPKPVVVATVVERERVETLRMTGSVFSRRYSKLSAEVEGLVQRLLVDKGSVVRKGDVLCKIDSTFAELDRDDATFRVKRGEAARAEAQRQYDEAIRLSKEKIIAASDLETLRSQLRIAESDLKRDVLREERSQEMLRRFDLRAPFDGMVVSKEIEEGEWIIRGGTAVTIVELDVVFVEFLIPQVYYHRLSRERDVVIQFEALGDREFTGRVQGVVALTNEKSRSFPVRIEIENTDHLIAPGMSARGVFPIQATEPGKVLLVPADAVLRSPAGRESIWVIDQDGTPSSSAVSERVVNVMGRQGNLLEVEANNLSAGDRVVIRGNERLQSEQLVQWVVRDGAGGGN